MGMGMKRIICLVAVLAVGLIAVTGASAATDGKKKPLPCNKYVPHYGSDSISNPPTWKCAQAINSWWLDCVAKAQETDTLSGASCFKLRATLKEVLYYATGASRRVKRNALIDFEGLLEGFCETYDTFYCGEAEDVERSIRKLS